MRILYFLETFGLGGIESFVVNVMEHSSHTPNEIECCVGRKVTQVFDARLSSSGCALYDLGNDVDGFPGFRYRTAGRLFADFLANHEYDVVQIHANHGVDYYLANTAKRAGSPCVVMHSHNTSVTRGMYKRLGHEAFKAVYANCVDGYFACSEEAAKWLCPERAYRAGAYTIIPNGVDLERFAFSKSDRAAVKREFGVSGCKVIGHIGRFNYQKNHEFLIKVFAGIAERFDDAVLMLVGEGELEDAVRNQVNDLGLGGRVIFAGPRNDVANLLSAFDLMLFPSRFEGLSIALVEAQVSGVHIVASSSISEDTVLGQSLELLPLEESLWVDVACDRLRCMEERQAKPPTESMKAYSIESSLEKMDLCYQEILTGGLR